MQVEPRRLKEILDERGVNLNYDPEGGKYTPWYRLPHKVQFGGEPFLKYNLNRLFCGFWMPLRIHIIDPDKLKEEIKGKIDTFVSQLGNGKESLDEKLAGLLVHEAGHADIVPFTLPLQIATSAYLASFVGSNNEVLDCAAKIFTFFGINRLASLFFTELPNEIYTYIRHGYSSVGGFKSRDMAPESKSGYKPRSIEAQLIELRDSFFSLSKKTLNRASAYLRPK